MCISNETYKKGLKQLPMGKFYSCWSNGPRKVPLLNDKKKKIVHLNNL
jgi:hypothetical protein